LFQLLSSGYKCIKKAKHFFMQIKNSLYKRTTPYIVVAFLIGLSACVGNQKSKNATETIPQRVDSGWVQLFDGKSLDGWQITNFGTQGTVQVIEGEIVLGMGDGCTGITWNGNFPKTDYEVKLEAKKITGNDFFCGMTFPVKDSFCTLIIGGWGGPVVGLSNIDGSDASDNESHTLKKFDHDTWYAIHLKVSSEKIEAWIDGEQVIDFSTSGKQLSVRSEVSLSKPFGICSWRTTSALRNIHLKE
jgi:hypothetical protein